MLSMLDRAVGTVPSIFAVISCTGEATFKASRVLDARLFHKLANKPLPLFLPFSSTFSSLSFCRILQPAGTSSSTISTRDFTDNSHAVDPFAAKKFDIGLLFVRRIFRESFIELTIAFPVKLSVNGFNGGNVMSGQ